MNDLVCKYCGARQTDSRATVCERCGAALPQPNVSGSGVAPRRRNGNGWILLTVLTVIGLGFLWHKHQLQMAATRAAQSADEQTRVVSAENPIVYTVAKGEGPVPAADLVAKPGTSSEPRISRHSVSTQQEHDAGPVPVNGKVEIPPGVAAKLLISRVEPDYPPEARAAGIQGTVVFMAIIGKDGHVKTLDFYDGPDMLADSAMAAASQWVYRPYLYKGEPVEMDTAIAVDFKK
jgi:outer membrane biosynthesis protein TonB